VWSSRCFATLILPSLGAVGLGWPAPGAAAEPVQRPPSIRETGRLADPAAAHPPVHIAAARSEPDSSREQPIRKPPEKTTGTRPAAPVPGKIDQSVLEKLIRSRFAALQECPIEVSRHKRISLGAASAGRLMLRWTIAPGGQVTETAVVAMSQVNPYVMDCVKRHMSGWLFPPPEGGPVRVERRFSFRSR
jgi:hypothetical protein